MKIKRPFLLALVIIAALVMTGCPASKESESGNDKVKTSEDVEAASSSGDVTLKAGGSSFTITLSDNGTAKAFSKMLPKKFKMEELNGNEKYKYLDKTLPSNAKDVGRIEAGDVMLYGDDCIVIFYKSFDTSYSYTRIGKIKSADGLAKALGKGSVECFFSVKGAKKASGKSSGKRVKAKANTVKLNSGRKMPVLGLGTWTLDDETAEKSVYTALKNGYRLIDTARYYGNEKGVGKAVRRAIKAGFVKRKDVFITSKILCDSYKEAEKEINASLKDLGVKYVDLMLIHQPGYDDKAVYRAMEKAVRKKKVRSIGISNYYTPEDVKEVLKFAKIKPAVIQNENHIFYQNTKLKKFVKKHKIKIESWYPFGGRGNTGDSFGNKTIKKIAKKHKKTPAQIILRWHVQAGYITIPGSSDPDHIKENINVFNFKLSGKEMEKIRRLNKNRRYENW